MEGDSGDANGESSTGAGASVAMTARGRVILLGAGRPPNGIAGAASRFWRESRRRLALPLEAASRPGAVAVPGSVVPASPLARAALQLVAIEPDELPPASPIVTGRAAPVDKGSTGLASLPPLRLTPTARHGGPATRREQPARQEQPTLDSRGGGESADAIPAAAPQNPSHTSNPLLKRDDADGGDDTAGRIDSNLPTAVTLPQSPLAPVASPVPRRRLLRCPLRSGCKPCACVGCGPCQARSSLHCGKCYPFASIRCYPCTTPPPVRCRLRNPVVSSRCPTAWTIAAYALLLGYLGVISAYLFLFGLWRSASEVSSGISISCSTPLAQPMPVSAGPRVCLGVASRRGIRFRRDVPTL